jgi:LysR family glycine cleavage system transcriptional activator
LKPPQGIKSVARGGRAVRDAQRDQSTGGQAGRILGVKLFERKHQQVVLTKRGAAYAARLQVLFDQIQEATVAHFHSQPERSLLRIGVLSTFAMRFLIPRLARFKQRPPGVDAANRKLAQSDRSQ